MCGKAGYDSDIFVADRNHIASLDNDVKMNIKGMRELTLFQLDRVVVLHGINL